MPTTPDKQVKTVDVATLKIWLDQGEALLIDVREPAEYATEHIAVAQLVPLSSFDPARVPQTPGKKLVLHCVMGARSAQAGQQLLAAGVSEVWNLQNGIQAWKDAGYEVRRGERVRISLDRQVRIVAGGLVLLGTLLGAFVSPWFLLLSGVLGADLAFSGITDACAMAMLLSKLPYNQRG